MELELGLALPNPHQPPLAAGGAGELVGGSAGACGKKRVFGDAFVGAAAAKATLLPLFVPEDGDDGGGGGGGRDDVVDHDRSNKKKRLVGWPPVKCARRRSCGGGGSGYVKVNMEGVPIGRKVDVSLHGSYQELLRTLERMFPSSDQQGAGADADRAEEEEEEVASHERRRCHPYVVTYEDGEGDWLLVGDDVPWEVFVKSVKRLKILA